MKAAADIKASRCAQFTGLSPSDNDPCCLVAAGELAWLAETLRIPDSSHSWVLRFAEEASVQGQLGAASK